MNAWALVLITSLWPLLAAATGVATDAAADRACARLVEVARQHQWADAGLRGEYHCERQEELPACFVFALRWRGEGVPEIGSNLVGYYQVDAASGEIHAWDLGEGRRTDAPAGTPNAQPSGPASCVTESRERQDEGPRR